MTWVLWQSASPRPTLGRRALGGQLVSHPDRALDGVRADRLSQDASEPRVRLLSLAGLVLPLGREGPWSPRPLPVSKNFDSFTSLIRQYL